MIVVDLIEMVVVLVVRVIMVVVAIMIAVIVTVEDAMLGEPSVMVTAVHVDVKASVFMVV